MENITNASSSNLTQEVRKGILVGILMFLFVAATSIFLPWGILLWLRIGWPIILIFIVFAIIKLRNSFFQGWKNFLVSLFIVFSPVLALTISWIYIIKIVCHGQAVCV